MRLNLEELSTVTAAIHAAAAYPERWPEALSAVAHLANSSESAPSHNGWQDLLASLDRLGLSAFIVTSAGMVHHMNDCAQNFLGGDEPVRVVNSRLVFSDMALKQTLEAALRKAAQSPARSSLFPLRCADNQVYEVNVSPLPPADKTGCLAAPALTLVVIARPRPDADRIARRVRRLFGLTDAESRVMAALTLGETVDQIATAHGVRVSTVRAQVRSIFEKTGVHRQTDLVRLALSGAPVIARPDRG